MRIYYFCLVSFLINSFNRDIMKKLYIPLFIVFLLISGCNDSATQASASGNFATKAEELPAQNESAIRADLKLINPILNKANSEAIASSKLLSEAFKSGNKEEVKSLLSKTKKFLEATNDSLMALNMQSQELQKIRTNIINGNMMAIKLNGLVLKDDETEEDKSEMTLLAKQLKAIHLATSSELDDFNAKYK